SRSRLPLRRFRAGPRRTAGTSSSARPESLFGGFRRGPPVSVRRGCAGPRPARQTRVRAEREQRRPNAQTRTTQPDSLAEQAGGLRTRAGTNVACDRSRGAGRGPAHPRGTNVAGEIGGGGAGRGPALPRGTNVACEIGLAEQAGGLRTRAAPT